MEIFSLFVNLMEVKVSSISVPRFSVKGTHSFRSCRHNLHKLDIFVNVNYQLIEVKEGNSRENQDNIMSSGSD